MTSCYVEDKFNQKVISLKFFKQHQWILARFEPFVADQTVLSPVNSLKAEDSSIGTRPRLFPLL